MSLYSSYENCVNILNRKMSFMIGFLNPFSYDPLKAEANFLFPFVGWSWFLFFLWQNITFPFSLLLGGDGFCFSFGKTSHFLFPFCWVVMAFVFPLAKHHIFLIFLPCWELKTEHKLFASKLKKYLTKSLPPSLLPSLPPQKHMKTKNVSKLLVHFTHVTYSPCLSKYVNFFPTT